MLESIKLDFILTVNGAANQKNLHTKIKIQLKLKKYQTTQHNWYIYTVHTPHTYTRIIHK